MTKYVEAAAVALCLWVGLYRTPAGALLRSAGALLVGVRADERPLLSYYSGGVVRTAADASLLIPVPHIPSPAEALGLGARAAYSGMPAERKQQLLTRLATRGIRPQDLNETETFTRLLRELGQSRKESEAMLALFAGETAASFAQARAGKDDLEALAQSLPPGLDAEVTAAGRALSFARAYGLGWPLAMQARITSGFGWRAHPVTGERLFHKGIDLSVPAGTEVRATAAGVVVRSSEDAFNGQIVVIEHGQGVRTFYLHNSERFVGRGQQVVPGQPIARSGASGIATGPHLHYQLELGAIPHDPTVFRK